MTLIFLMAMKPYKSSFPSGHIGMFETVAERKKWTIEHGQYLGDGSGSGNASWTDETAKLNTDRTAKDARDASRAKLKTYDCTVLTGYIKERCLSDK